MKLGYKFFLKYINFYCKLRLTYPNDEGIAIFFSKLIFMPKTLIDLTIGLRLFFYFKSENI